jgi:alkylated DNA repair dioxygenase AlkB
METPNNNPRPALHYVDYKLLHGGVLQYYPNFLTVQEADFYFETFELLPFLQGQVRGGKENRLSRFFSNLKNPNGTLRDYYYAGKQNTPLEMTEEMNYLREQIENSIHQKFNSCLVNYYADGKQTIGLHSDSEASLVTGSAIASISLGAPRYFDVHAKDGLSEKIRIEMVHGSMIVMAGTMQQHYKHTVPTQSSIKQPRINLTYRLSK